MLRRLARKYVWATGCALLALGAPLGLAAFQSFRAGEKAPARLLERMERNPAEYLWVGLSTAAVFAAAGYLFGRIADRARVEARLDPLTGLLNRRAFQERLELEFARSHRSGAPISLLMFDLDDLKRINDRYGHDVGDLVLRRAAGLLAANVRATDAIGARIGGDEFVLLAPDTPHASALRLAERIRISVDEDGTPPGEEPGFTMSVGVASLDLLRHGTSSALLSDADHALYEAKRRGRGQVAGE